MRVHISYLERINQLFPPEEETGEDDAAGDKEDSEHVGKSGIGGKNSPAQAGSGPTHTSAVEEWWKNGGRIAPPAPEVDALPAALLPAALEDSWRALTSGEDVPDVAEACHRCGTPTDCYDDAGVAWCFVCFDGRMDAAASAPWQDLLDCLPTWQTDTLARRAARAYHEAGRPRVRLKLYAGASAEWQQGRALWQRLGWALQGDPRHFPQAWAVLRELAADGGRSAASPPAIFT